MLLRRPLADGKALARMSARHYSPQANAKVMQLISAYRSHGHLAAQVDPLGLSNSAWKKDLVLARSLDPAAYGFTKADLERPVDLGTSRTEAGFVANHAHMSLGGLVAELRRCYTSSIGVELSHIRSREQVAWLHNELERAPTVPTAEERRQMLETLSRASRFEAFCGSKFSGVKRFGLEGCEALIVGLDALLERASLRGVEHVVMGMPHRGRLSVLANTMEKPLQQIFAEFRGSVSDTHVDQALLRQRTGAHIGPDPTASGLRLPTFACAHRASLY